MPERLDPEERANRLQQLAIVIARRDKVQRELDAMLAHDAAALATAGAQQAISDLRQHLAGVDQQVAIMEALLLP
jgi:hypothetical protein